MSDIDTNLIKVLNAIHKTQHIRATIIDKKDTILYTDHTNAEKQVLDSSLYQKVVKDCREDRGPKLIINKFIIATAGIYEKTTEEVIVLGPIFLGSISEQNLQAELMKTFHDETIVEETLGYVSALHSLSQSMFIAIISFLSQYLNNEMLDPSNQSYIIMEDWEKETPNLTSMEQNNLYDQNIYDMIDAYESYLFEQKIIESIRTGNKEKILSLSKFEENIQVGNLSKENEVLRQRKNEFICAVTLATRAAIQGGMNVEKAFSLGDYYIRRIEEMNQIEKVASSAYKMFLDFTIRVSNIVDIKKYSHITDSCIQYINDHFYDMISIQEMAEYICVSKNHMLIKFKEETNLSIVDYIKDVKISEAKLILTYGYMSISELSEYLSFSSQSYFTSVFKQIVGMTPKQYREKR